MDRRDFMKGAAAAALVAALPAEAAISRVDIAAEAVTTARYANCIVVYEHGTKWFDSDGKVCGAYTSGGHWPDRFPPIDLLADDFGKVRAVWGIW